MAEVTMLHVQPDKETVNNRGTNSPEHVEIPEIWPEVVTPLRQAVRLITDKQVDPMLGVELLQLNHAALETFWSDEDKLVPVHHHTQSEVRRDRRQACERVGVEYWLLC